MGGVLAVYLGPVSELALQGFPEDGVERLVLGSGDVHSAQGKCNHKLESLELVARRGG
jgi:hypothetical protein